MKIEDSSREHMLVDRLRRPDGRGKVLRPDDRRLQPHSPEHRAAIKAGALRAEYGRAQGRLAQAGKTHVFTPWNLRYAPGRAIEPKPPMLEFGGCWACWSAGASAPHRTEA